MDEKILVMTTFELKKKAEEYDLIYENIIRNRYNFVNNCFLNYQKEDLSKWGIGEEYLCDPFIYYIMEKEGEIGAREKTVTIDKIKKKRFGKEKIVKKKEVIKNELYYKIDGVRDIKEYPNLRYYSYKNKKSYIVKEMPYETWQEFKKYLLLVKKYINEYIIFYQRKKICTLTNCYKDKIEDRICELCGSTVTGEAIYCSKCGGKINGKL